MAANVLGFLTCALMLMIVIAHGDCADIVRESALEADSGSQRRLGVHRVSISPTSSVRYTAN